LGDPPGMQGGVFRKRHHLKIFRTVICFIAVYVMNNFSGRELATYDAFNNDPMLVSAEEFFIALMRTGKPFELRCATTFSECSFRSHVFSITIPANALCMHSAITVAVDRLGASGEFAYMWIDILIFAGAAGMPESLFGKAVGPEIIPI
jgi:hypothetical protein